MPHTSEIAVIESRRPKEWQRFCCHNILAAVRTEIKIDGDLERKASGCSGDGRVQWLRIGTGGWNWAPKAAGQ